MKINNLYEYTKLEKKTFDNGKRHYISPTGDKLPSVTTILDQTQDKTFLINWRKRIGDKEANRQVKHAVDAGNLMHKHVEDHILGKERKRTSNHIHELAYKMADNIIEQGLVNVNEVWGVEVPLYFPGLYAGTTDLVGVYKKNPAIMDHKNSKKIKKREWIESYFCQGAAYALCHNEVYGTNINQVIIFMSSRELEYKTFEIVGNEFHKYCDIWIEKLDQYLETNHKSNK